MLESSAQAATDVRPECADLQPVIVCGLGKVGWRVLDYLRATGLAVVAIDQRCAADDTRLSGVRFLQGDFREATLLEKAGVQTARGVLVITSDDLVNTSAALMVRSLNPHVRIIVRLYNENLIARLGKAVKNTFTLSVAELTAPLLALTALQGQGLGAFGDASNRTEIIDLPVTGTSWLAGQNIQDATARISALPLAHLPKSGTPAYLADVDRARVLAPGDRIIACGEREALAAALRELDGEAIPTLYLAGWTRRTARVVWRAAHEMDTAVKICTVVLVSVVAFSTLVYHFAIDLSWHESLYRTVSVIATGADLRADRLEPWQKIFISGLRLTGAALIASFTAIFTNYLLRARLRGALDIGRIPDSGHVIVCGLGNIGFAVVKELLRYNERVVVIERQRDSRFIGGLRRLGVASIIADATVLEVLRQAHAGSAAAVIAATNDELANLEIALLARDLNPRLRVIVLLQDLNLARTLREAANIRFALSIPNLVAPAFVASLFGDRVHSVFLMENRIFAVMELRIDAADAFLAGRLLSVVARDYRLMVVKLCRGEETRRNGELDIRLMPGDCLTVIAALGDLDRIFRRERVPLDCCVEVTEIAAAAQVFIAEFLAAREGIGVEAARAMLAHLPASLSNRLSAGEAEDLARTLVTQGIQARVRRISDAATSA
jgi:Trk K+ transport system NAD-binding subunit